MFSLGAFSAAPFSTIASVDSTIVECDVTATLTFSQTGSGQYIGVANKADLLILVDQLTVGGVFNNAIQQSLTLVGSLSVNQTFNDGTSQSLTLVQRVNTIIDLAISQALTLVWEDRPAGFGTLDFSQMTTAQLVKLATVSQTLPLLHTAACNFIHNIEVCHCLTLTDKVRQQTALSISQTLVLQLLETLSVQQVLDLIQTITDNFNDDNLCCGIIGGVKDKAANQSLAVSQQASAQMVYNCRVSQTLDLYSTTAWRT